MKFAIKKNGNELGKVNVFWPSGKFERKELLQDISKEIESDKEIGYAGYLNKEGLRAALDWAIFTNNDFSGSIEDLDINSLKNIISETVKSAGKYIENHIIRIFVFPTFDDFVAKEMDGVTGFSPWNNVIHIYMHHKKHSLKALGKTLLHELSHAIRLNYEKVETLGDWLVFDGIAEHFREHIMGGDKEKLVSILSENEILQILKEINLNSTDEKVHREIFYGSGKYKMWAGYSIGYYIVSQYLKKQKEIDWNEILRKPSAEILSISNKYKS